MFPLVNIFLLIGTGLLLAKLLTTNHWTYGKKNLVAIISSLFWKFGIEVLSGLLFFQIPWGILMLIANLPLAITMLCVALVVHWFDE